MEILRCKLDEFNIESFIEYYNDNVSELLTEYPHYISRVCLVDRDYMDVIVYDEDYENLDSPEDYKNVLMDEEYGLLFSVGKTYEGAEKIEFIDGSQYALNHMLDDIYEEDNVVKNIGDLSLNVDNLIGFLIEMEDNNEIAIYPVDFEHGGEISQPRIRKVDDLGDTEKIIQSLVDNFICN